MYTEPLFLHPYTTTCRLCIHALEFLGVPLLVSKPMIDQTFMEAGVNLKFETNLLQPISVVFANHRTNQIRRLIYTDFRCVHVPDEALERFGLSFYELVFFCYFDDVTQGPHLLPAQDHLGRNIPPPLSVGRVLETRTVMINGRF